MPTVEQMVQRQQVLADFGDFALRSERLDDVLTEACRLVSAALDTPRAKVLEIQDGGCELLLRAGVGWTPEIVGRLRLQMSERSSESFSIREGRPVISRDIGQEDRFDIPAFMREAGVVALVNVPIFVPGRQPYGLLQVDAAEPRDFGQDEIEFLRTYATILGPVIDRLRKVESLTRTETHLLETEERNRQFAEASPAILWARDAARLRLDYLSPAFVEIFGTGENSVREGSHLRRWLEMIVPVDRRDALGAMRRLQTGERVGFEYRIRRRRDGAVRLIRDVGFPIRDAAGQVHRLGGVAQDITDLKAAEAALTHSEQRLRTLVEGMSQLVWRAVDGGDWTWASPQWTAFTGQSEPDSHHLGWLDTVHPEDHPAALGAWAQALETGGFAVEFRIRNASTAEYRWFQTRVTPVRDGAGTIIEWLGTSTDIHDLRTLQEQQKVLVAELQHRTRNLLGVVRSMVESTLLASTDLDGFSARFRDRLDALARVQGLLSRLNAGDRVTFDTLIRSELKALGAFEGPAGKVSLEGPHDVALRSSTVQTFALAMHELATNALKYGALRQPSGRLSVTWRLEAAGSGSRPWLHVDWRESGVPVPVPGDGPAPQGTGQGRLLIERALPYQLGARTSFVLGADGVRCSIALPVSFQGPAEPPRSDAPAAT